MRKAFRVFSATAALAALVLPLPGGAITTVSSLQSKPQLLDGRDVILSGRVSALSRGITMLGQDYATFVLCDTNCITVYVKGDPDVREGDYVTIHNALGSQPVGDPLLINGIVVNDYDIY